MGGGALSVLLRISGSRISVANRHEYSVYGYIEAKIIDDFGDTRLILTSSILLAGQSVHNAAIYLYLVRSSMECVRSDLETSSEWNPAQIE
jgi:hypothetical protein